MSLIAESVPATRVLEILAAAGALLLGLAVDAAHAEVFDFEEFLDAVF
jgi:hypothetical protein